MSLKSNWQRPASTITRQPHKFEETKLYKLWERRVKDGSPNDLVIAITPSSRTGVSGTGKTTAATVLAKEFDISDSGFDATEKGTLDAGTLAYDVLPDVGQGSALIFDEAQGAPGTDSVNARRGMKSESMDAINGILANRDMRISLIIIAQQLSMLDKNLLPMIDAWLLIRKEPADPNGPLMTHHEIHINDYDIDSSQTKTPSKEDLTWPALPVDDPDYREMERLKQRAKRRQSDSDEKADESEVHSLEDLPKQRRDSMICAAYDTGVPQPEIAEQFGLDQSQVSRIVNGKS